METTLTATCPWEIYLPDHVCLYYVDYDQSLDNHTKLVWECVKKNGLYPLSEEIFDWWECPEEEYIREMQSNMENDDVEWNDEWRDEIRDKICDLDTSTPINDLLRNTDVFNCYYDLGYHASQSWCADEEERDAEIKAMCELLNISPDSPMVKKIEDVYDNATSGGHLRIYFPAEVKQMISHEGYELNPKRLSDNSLQRQIPCGNP